MLPVKIFCLRLHFLKKFLYIRNILFIIVVCYIISVIIINVIIITIILPLG